MGWPWAVLASRLSRPRWALGRKRPNTVPGFIFFQDLFFELKF
jgi:hypothetical protein